MIITETRIKIIGEEKLLAFGIVLFDDVFVVRDLKVIQGREIFVGMPSRKISDKCSRCSRKNAIIALFCNWCGCSLASDRGERLEDGRLKLHADLAHPINTDFRRTIQATVIAAYMLELEKSKEPGYISNYEAF